MTFESGLHNTLEVAQALSCNLTSLTNVIGLCNTDRQEVDTVSFTLNMHALPYCGVFGHSLCGVDFLHSVMLNICHYLNLNAAIVTDKNKAYHISHAATTTILSMDGTQHKSVCCAQSDFVYLRILIITLLPAACQVLFFVACISQINHNVSSNQQAVSCNT